MLLQTGHRTVLVTQSLKGHHSSQTLTTPTTPASPAHVGGGGGLDMQLHRQNILYKSEWETNFSRENRMSNLMNLHNDRGIHISSMCGVWVWCEGVCVCVCVW